MGIGNWELGIEFAFRRSLLITHYSLLITHYSLLIAHCLFREKGYISNMSD
ncbi:MAG: hypothetical protein F6K47_30840 [Symploca sp. SIO2E6]|nr:hypothetical protein [Symploca sp. SIO2E6]